MSRRNMKVWVAVEAFQGVVQDVHLFFTEDKADKWAKKYVNDDAEYLAYLRGKGEYPEDSDYDQTKIFELDIQD